MSGHARPLTLASQLPAFFSFLPSSRVLCWGFAHTFGKENKTKTGIGNGIILINTKEAWMAGGGGEGVPGQCSCQLQVQNAICHRDPSTQYLSPRHWLKNIPCLANVLGTGRGLKTSWRETGFSVYNHQGLVGNYHEKQEGGVKSSSDWDSVHALVLQLTCCVTLSPPLNLPSLRFLSYIKNSNTCYSTLSMLEETSKTI